MSKNIFAMRQQKQTEQINQQKLSIFKKNEPTKKDLEREKQEQIKSKIDEFETIRGEKKQKKDKREPIQKELLEEIKNNPKRKIILEYLKKFII